MEIRPDAGAVAGSFPHMLRLNSIHGKLLAPIITFTIAAAIFNATYYPSLEQERIGRHFREKLDHNLNMLILGLQLSAIGGVTEQVEGLKQTVRQQLYQICLCPAPSKIPLKQDFLQAFDLRFIRRTIHVNLKGKINPLFLSKYCTT